jgi:hypothetical protein
MKIDELLAEERITKDKIQIWGGEIKENEWQQFINSWDFSGMPYTIIETFKEIKFTKEFSDHANLNPKTMQRIRIFGKSGDLDLRSDFPSINWRYIGKSDLPSKIKEDKKTENYWDKNEDKEFFLEEKEALLWGKYWSKHNGRNLWLDNRVARAELSYPVNGSPKRVKICYKTFSERGCISFLWFTELKGGIGDE